MINLIKRLKVDFRIKLGYGAAFILLLVSYLVTWYANQELILQSRWVVHSNMLVNHLESLGSYMKDAETGVRGYIISNDESFLQPYVKSRKLVDSTFDLLKYETKDNTSEQIVLFNIKDLINQKFNILNNAILQYRAHQFTIDEVGSGSYHPGKIVMDSIRSKINVMKTSEQQVFASRDNDLRAKYEGMKVIIVTSLILAFLFAGLGLATYLRENWARKFADEKVLEYQRQLQQRIGELDEVNKELIEMRSKEQFAATGRMARTIAHEVRNPLTNIDLAVSQLKTDLNTNDETAIMLFDMINRNSKRINQLITELLNATRFAELNYQAASINTLLDESLELAKDRIALNHISIEKQYTKGISNILVDIERIKIAFLNIIVNAVEAMEKKGGVLRIVTKRENEKCIIEIIDNGIGMDEAKKEKLFEPYYTTKSKGNGLGLTNTQNIILNHKGTIAVESKLGEGTRFVIKFDFVKLE